MARIARTVAQGNDDLLIKTKPLLEIVNKPWEDFLSVDAQEQERTLFRKHERTGRPLGADSFIGTVSGLSYNAQKAHSVAFGINPMTAQQLIYEHFMDGRYGCVEEDLRCFLITIFGQCCHLPKMATLPNPVNADISRGFLPPEEIRTLPCFHWKEGIAKKEMGKYHGIGSK